MSNYEPGTVAKVTNAGKEMLAFRVGWPAPDWMSADVGTLHAITDVRPLVVLDLEDPAGLLATLNDAQSHMLPGGPNYGRLTGLIAEIEQQTRPPKPPEPTGLGAVVEDASGERWIRCTDRLDHAWQVAGAVGSPWVRYVDIDAVRKLSEGWEPRHD